MRAIRNIAIIAHVDHGKTTLVDKLLRQSGTFAAYQHLVERVMDSNDLERERGITILAKNCAVQYEGTHINIVDTPGHADFGGEVERVLSMVDGVLLLVDAVEGPMPQTRFVTRKALALGLKPIVVVNKVDRPGARPDWVVNHTFDLFDKLGATEAQLDFPIIYASALQGWAVTDLKDVPSGKAPAFDTPSSLTPGPSPEGRGETNESPGPSPRGGGETNESPGPSRGRRGEAGVSLRPPGEESGMREGEGELEHPSPPGRRDGDEGSMKPLFEAILKHVPAREDDADGPLQLQICSLDYSSYVGRIGIGRVIRGRIRSGQLVTVLHGPDNKIVAPVNAKVNQVLVFKGLERVVVEEALAGDIVLVNGIEEIGIGVTITDVEHPEALPLLKVDEPTLTMNFQVNTSPLAGREGKYVTSRQLRERLQRELMANVALRVVDTDDADVFEVSGRGELHLTILLETMRREGYELAVSRPRVVIKEVNGEKQEPYEMLTVDVEEINQGAVMEALGGRRGDLQDMQSDGRGRVRLDYRIPARGLIGFQSEFLTTTRGTGLMSHVFDDYGPMKPDMAERRNGVLISAEAGEAVAYALWKLQERGRMFVSPGDPLYEGIIIGIHSRDNDLVVNPIKGKQLTNVRASGTDEAVRLTPPIQVTLESAIEFIADDELVEITPKSIRIRKRLLREQERKRTRKAEQAHAA